MEKFNPKEEQYKEVADLPTEHQGEFMDVKGGGFVSREAIFSQEIAESMAHIKESERELIKKRKAELLLRDKEEEEVNKELMKELPDGELKDKVLGVIKEEKCGSDKKIIWDESKKAVAIANKGWDTWNLFVIYNGKVQEKWGYSFYGDIMDEKLKDILSVRIEGDRVYVDTVFLDKDRKERPRGEKLFDFSSVEKI